MAAKSKTFEEHYKKLETLSEELQENKDTIDELVPRMTEALESIKVCKDVLKKTESQLEKIQKEFSEA